MTIGENIKARRLELGMSQQALADKTGYATRGAINKVENGSVDVNQTKIKLFANALNTTPAYIMGWDIPDSENEDMKKAVEEILKSIPTEKREEFLQYIKITAKLFENKEMI